MVKPIIDVYGIGNAIIDLQVQIDEDRFAALGLEKGGMKLLEQDEQKQLLSTFEADELNRASGGSAANTMIALAQLGASTGYGCIVADDENGRFYLEEMKELGIELHARPVPGEVTGTSVILITPDAERTMNTHLGASALFGPEHVSEEMIRMSSWLYVEGYLFSSERGAAAVEKAVAIAKEANVKIAVTFSDGFIVEVFGDALRKTVADADLIFANLNEACSFAGSEDEDVVFEALRKTVSSVVMTRGEKGARVYHDGVESLVAPFPVKAVDETGAGDMFAGGFLFGLSQGLSGADAGKMACRLASEVVGQLGPRLEGDIREIASSLNLL
jgi:hypothetical protein